MYVNILCENIGCLFGMATNSENIAVMDKNIRHFEWKNCFYHVDIGPDEHPAHYNAIVSYVSPTTNFLANIAVTMHPPHFASSTPVHSLSLRFPFFRRS